MSGFSTRSTTSTGDGRPSSDSGYSSAVHADERHADPAVADPAVALVAAPTLACIECSRPWLIPSERWRLKVLEEDEPETVPYCPDCFSREFGSF
jgi:hypothetical protein